VVAVSLKNVAAAKVEMRADGELVPEDFEIV
jgi:hypothetical protein